MNNLNLWKHKLMLYAMHSTPPLEFNYAMCNKIYDDSHSYLKQFSLVYI